MRIKFNVSRFAEEGDKVVSQKALRSYHEKMRNLLKQSQGDWNENNENKLNYVKNRPFYSKGYIAEEKEYIRNECYHYGYYKFVAINEEGQPSDHMPTVEFSYSANDKICYFEVQSYTFEGVSDSENYWYMWDNLKLQLGDKVFVMSPLEIVEKPTGEEAVYSSSWYCNETKTIIVCGNYFNKDFYTYVWINLTKEGLEDEIY